MKIKAKGKKDELSAYLNDKGYSVDYEQVLIHCGSGQEKALLAHLLEGGYDYSFEYSNEILAEIEEPSAEE